MSLKSVGRSVGKPVMDALIGAGVFWAIYKLTGNDPQQSAAPGRMSTQVEAAILAETAVGAMAVNYLGKEGPDK